METDSTPSRRLTQLSFWSTLAILLSLVSFLLSNYNTGRMLREGSTITLDPGQSPVRFLGFAATAVFLVACLSTRGAIDRREFRPLLALLGTQFLADRLSDLGQLYCWQIGILTVGMMWHKVPLHPKLMSAMAWLFLLINVGATILRPDWAFVVSAEDGHVLFGRLAACATHPNELGLYAGLFAMLVAINVRTFGWKVLLAGLVLILLLSQSRTSVLCLLIGLFFYWRSWRLSRIFTISIPLISIGYALLAAAGLTEGDLSLTGRTTLWSVLIDGVSRSPIIGLGSEGVLMASKYVQVGFQAQNHAHNAALQMLVQGGIVGLTCYCLFVLFMRKSANRTHLGSVVLLFLLVHSLTESTLPWAWPYLLCFGGAFTLLEPRPERHWPILGRLRFTRPSAPLATSEA